MDFKKIKDIANKLLLKNQELKRTLDLRNDEIQTLKELIKIKEEEIYSLQAELIKKEME